MKFSTKKFTNCLQFVNTSRHARRREGEKETLSIERVASKKLYDTVIVILAVGEHPAIGRKWLVLTDSPSHIIGSVACDPTLEMIAVVSGEYLTRAAIISEMHS